MARKTSAPQQAAEKPEKKETTSPKTGEGSPPAPSEDTPFPYLGQVAEPGGVLLGIVERPVERPLTREDLMDIAEEQIAIAREHMAAQDEMVQALLAEKLAKEAKAAATKRQRDAEAKQKECGERLAAIAIEMETKTRREIVKVNQTLTSGNEVIEVDAATGEQLSRKTATADDLDRSRQKQPALFDSGQPRSVATAAPAQRTTAPGSADGGDLKLDPQHVPVIVSVVAKVFDGLKPLVRGSLCVAIPDSDEFEELRIEWLTSNNAPDRLVAQMPTWAARKLSIVADGIKKLDYRFEPAAAGALNKSGPPTEQADASAAPVSGDDF